MNYKSIAISLLLPLIISISSYAQETDNRGIIFITDKNKSKSSEDLSNNVEKVLKQVKEIRNLPTKTPVAVGVKTTNELNSFLKKLFEREYSASDLRKDTLLLQRLGLIKKGVDLKNTFLNLYTEQIAGLYDNDAKELYVIENAKMGNLESSIVISHELTHALQDQNFNIKKFMGDSKTNGDRAMARTAVIEGEAMVASMEYVVKDTAKSGLKAFVGLLKNPLGASMSSMNSLKNVPGFLIEQMMFPYVKGQTFVSYVYKYFGSWDKFNSIYQNPPESTEQIMHPEKYIAGELPVKIELDEKIIKDKNWKLITKDTFGEFFLLNYFLEYLSEDEATRASEGWGGDFSTFYVKDNSDDTVLIYKSVWDSEKDAREFFDSYIDALQVRYDKKFKNEKKLSNSYKAQAIDGKIYITLNGNSVNIAEGFTDKMEKGILSDFNTPQIANNAIKKLN